MSYLATYVYTYAVLYVQCISGADPGFSEGGSEHRGGSLNQGVWGVQPPRSYRVLHF